MVNESKEKFERLISRFLENQVIPFIGAGVSCNAKSESNDASSMKTEDLKSMLINNLRELKKGASSIQKQWVDWFCRAVGCDDNANNIKDCACNDSCKLRCANFANLCEVYSWLSDNDDYSSSVCGVLGIDKFTSLSFNPTFAHRYIAFLAREKIIDEIITTNYDNLIEKAYEDTFGSIEFELKKDSLLGVCTDLNEYRNKRNAVNSYRDKVYGCYLRVYKINGCACKFQQVGNKNAAASKILLTEKQLQDWRERQWAKDLFKDRLRSSTILFSGFGSDEPQVRHTALQVVEEFATRDNLRSNGEVKPSSLFIAGYEKELTFNQMQILYEYIKAYTKDDEKVTVDKVYQNAFTAKDIKFFSSEGNEKEQDKLDSDLFWKRVFQAIYWRLVREYCSKNSPIYSFLSAITPRAGMLLSAMLNWYAPENEPFGAFPELLELSEKEDIEILPIVRWICCINGNKNDIQHGFYISLHEKPVLIILMLTLLFIIATEGSGCKVTWEQLKEKIFVSRDVLGFKNICSFADENVIVSLKDAESSFYNEQEVSLPEDFNYKIIIQFLISNGVYKRFERIKVKQVIDDVSNGPKSVRHIIVYQIPINKIFDNWRSGGIGELYNQLCNIISDPNVVQEQLQPHLHNRANRI